MLSFSLNSLALFANLLRDGVWSLLILKSEFSHTSWHALLTTSYRVVYRSFWYLRAAFSSARVGATLPLSWTFPHRSCIGASLWLPLSLWEMSPLSIVFVLSLSLESFLTLPPSAAFFLPLYVNALSFFSASFHPALYLISQLMPFLLTIFAVHAPSFHRASAWSSFGDPTIILSQLRFQKEATSARYW